ncbi:ribose-phosphate pyrophosphokinase [Clostridium sp. 19966]|uniref:ribose-phosphate diphosphokinase n=1 Tax=Clostridium sp. 19966 TaxID=2768166 RepID=UPI0028DD4E7E|nr:ribose-phosphate pyrophosphokinase [Clostridium sp. 19966]MDT8719304.1 ribose-phosphate pyrophosphokinase [Clostridium sp. 19966]
MIREEVRIFSGSNGKELGKRICDCLGTTLGESKVIKFLDGNIFVKIEEAVMNRRIYLVQTIGLNPNDEFMELLFWMDAFKRAGALSVTLVIPYFGYGKSDKQEEDGVSIRARVCAECIERLGVKRVITMDLHSPQVLGFFNSPIENLMVSPVLCEFIRSLNLKEYVVVSPDAGFSKDARKIASHLGVGVAIGDKTRKCHDEKAEILDLIGDIKGKDAVIFDDFTISGGTLIELAKALKARGAGKIYACLSHLLLNEENLKKVEQSDIDLIVSTDSVNNNYITNSKRIKILSAAPLFAEAIDKIEDGKLVSEIYDKKNLEKIYAKMQ